MLSSDFLLPVHTGHSLDGSSKQEEHLGFVLFGVDPDLGPILSPFDSDGLLPSVGSIGATPFVEGFPLPFDVPSVSGEVIPFSLFPSSEGISGCSSTVVTSFISDVFSGFEPSSVESGLFKRTAATKASIANIAPKIAKILPKLYLKTVVYPLNNSLISFLDFASGQFADVGVRGNIVEPDWFAP